MKVLELRHPTSLYPLIIGASSIWLRIRGSPECDIIFRGEYRLLSKHIGLPDLKGTTKSWLATKWLPSALICFYFKELKTIIK